MNDYFENETRKHQQLVGQYLILLAKELLSRASKHDNSKLEDPECKLFAEQTPILKGLTYGSDEYKASLEKLGPALHHHYLTNRHHPEYHDLHGRTGSTGGSTAAMNVVDLAEMVCDWLAATSRHADGDIIKSIEHNKTKFNIDDALVKVIEQTVNLIDDLSKER